MGGELVTQISWKTIMIETLKLLKSKQCGSVAKTVLAQLHGRCFTLANSMECISHVLGVGLAVTASKGRKSRVSLVMESPKPRRTSASSGTNIEVIEWLAETTERERALEVIDQALRELRALFDEAGHGSSFEAANEVQLLRGMRDVLVPKLPASRRAELRERLQAALDAENYELAAILRDELRMMD